MDSFAYLPPLRGAVLRLVASKEMPITAVALAAAAQVTEVRARAYASILLKCRALRVGPLGYETGPKWSDWSSRITRARPHTGGNPSSAAMDAMRRPLATNVTRLREAKEWSSCRLAREAGIDLRTVRRLETRCCPPPFPAVVMIARALGVQVEELIA